MATITTRSGKGSPLTNTEVDDNFTNLNTAKYESGDSPTFGGIYAAGLSVVSTGGQDYTQGDIRISSATTDTPEGRGQGLFLFNEGTDRTWFAGTLYGSAGDYGIGFKDGATLQTASANSQNTMFTLYSGVAGAVFNENSSDRDFRVESDTNSHMLLVDASTNKVVIGASGAPLTGGSTPAFSLAAKDGIALGTDAYTFGYVGNGGNVGDVLIRSNAYPANVGTQPKVTIQAGTAGGGLRTHATFDSVSAVFNEDSADIDFRVESNTNTHALFVDAGNNRVEIQSNYKFGNIYGTPKYTKTFALAANAKTWVKLGSYDSPSKFRVLYRAGSGNSEEVGWIEVHGSYSNSDIRWHKNTYKFHVEEIRTVHSNPGQPWELWALVQHGTNFGSTAYFWFQIAEAFGHDTTAFAVSNTTGTPGTANKSLVDAQSGYRTMSTDTIRSDDIHIHKSSGSQLRVTDTGIGETYGASFRGYGLAGSGGYAEIGTLDNNTYNRAIQSTSQATYTRIYANTGTNGSTSERFMVSSAAVVVNDASADADFRVESDGNSNMLFVDSGLNRVAVGHSTPTYTFDVVGTGRFTDQVKYEEPTVFWTTSGTKYYTNLATGSLYSAQGAVIIQTNIPGHNVVGNANMFAIRLVGYNYNSKGAIDLWLGCYAGEGNFYSTTAHGICPDIWEDNLYVGTDSNGKVVFRLGLTTQTQGCELAVAEFVQGFQNVNAAYSKGWTISTATTLPTLTYETKLDQFAYSPNSHTFNSWVKAKGFILDGGRSSLDSDNSGSVSASDALNYIKYAQRVQHSTFNSGIALEAPWSPVSGTNWSNNKFRFHLWRSHSNDVLAAAVNSSTRSGDGDSFVFGNTNIASGAEMVTTGLAVDGRDMYLYGQYKLAIQGFNEVSVNDQSADADFRVESNNNTHMLFVDAGNDRLGVNKSTPTYGIHAQVNDGTLALEGPNGGVTPRFYAKWKDGDTGLSMGYEPGYAVAYIDNTYPRSQGQVYGDIAIRTKDSGSQVERLRIIADKVGGYNVQVTQTGLRVGRSVYNWFQYGQSPGSGNRYLHMKTTLWSGANNSNSQPTMSLFHVKGYTYDARTIDTKIGFHNWLGSYYNLRITDTGSWAAGVSPYTSSDGYVVLVLDLGTSYPGISIDWHQSFEYGYQNKQVSAYSASSSSSGVY